MREQAEVVQVSPGLLLDPCGIAALEHHLRQGRVQADVDLHAGAAGAAALLDADLAVATVVGSVATSLAVVGLGAHGTALDGTEAYATCIAGAE